MINLNLWTSNQAHTCIQAFFDQNYLITKLPYNPNCSFSYIYIYFILSILSQIYCHFTSWYICRLCLQYTQRKYQSKIIRPLNSSAKKFTKMFVSLLSFMDLKHCTALGSKNIYVLFNQCSLQGMALNINALLC